MILIALALTAAVAPCKTYDANLPYALRGWTRIGQTLDTGHAMVLPAPGKAAETVVTIRKAGRFGIAVDSNAWVDVYRGRGKALTMASESRGPACSTIRKIVRYNLVPGIYRVTAAKVEGGRARLMLVYSDARKPHEVLRRHRRYR